ncbi:hypothetical protein ACIO02_35465 [Streptomyces sp. NPDC087568]
MAPLGFPKPIKQDDPRLKGHETVYQPSRGGHFPQQQRPVPGTPKKPQTS